MDKFSELSEDEINFLEMVFNGKFINLASAPKGVESLILKGYVLKKPQPLLPMMPIQYSYELTVHGLMILRVHRPQYR